MLGALALWEIAAKLKNEPRRGWSRVSRIKRMESVAEHSFGVTILTLFESARRGYNVERALTLALIHDLEEAITGDLAPEDKAKMKANKVRSLRRAARARITEAIPIAQRSQYRSMWRDLERVGTREAQLVKDLDKLEMALQARRYADLGGQEQELRIFYESALRQIKDAAIRKAARLSWLSSSELNG